MLLLKVNLTDNEKSIGNSPVAYKPSILNTGIFAALLLLYGFFNYGAPSRGEVMIQFLVNFVSYFLVIYLFYEMIKRAAIGQNLMIIALALVTIIASLFFSGFTLVYKIIIEWSMILSVGLVTGRIINLEQRGFKAYLYGLGLVLAGGLLFFIPDLQMFIAKGGELQKEMLGELESFLSMVGGTSGEKAESVFSTTVVTGFIIRLIPSILIFNLVIKFSVAFLFVGLLYHRVSQVKIISDFRSWRMPFVTNIGLLLGLALRLSGVESLTLVADNILFVLLIFYCITGLSYLEHLVKRLSFPLSLRIMFYLALFLTHVYGFFAAVFIGVIDSFIDFRTREKLSLEEK